MASSSSSQHDLLKPYLSQDTELGRHVLECMEEDGYVVLPEILSPSECDVELNRLWDFCEAIAPPISRSKPESWYPSDQTEKDPWPHSGWKFLPDMCQSYRAGWLFGHLREKLAVRVFEPLYGTRELHSSKEGFTFYRPTVPSSNNADAAVMFHPLMDVKRTVCNKPSSTNGEHFDQRAAHTGLHCIQSSTCFIDQIPEKDGCFLCWPGSHKEHADICQDTWRGRSDWVPLTDEELDGLRECGYAPKRIYVNKGDVILWRSDLCHCGASPLQSTGFRAVSYTCMLPASLTPDDVYSHKLLEYQTGLSGDHRPNVKSEHLSAPKSKSHKTKKGEEWDNPVSAKQGGSEYFDGLPELTLRQAELYGLVRYGGEAVLPDELRIWEA